MPDEPAPMSMFGIALNADELDRAPHPSDLTQEHELRPVSWGARAQSATLGALLGSVVSLVLLTPSLPLSMVWWSMPGAVGLAILLYLGLRRTTGLDGRWLLATAAAVVLAVVWLPIPGVQAGGRYALAAACIVLVGFFLIAVKRIGDVQREVAAWNEAYGRLAQDPVRAVTARLAVHSEPAGDQRRFVGQVAYEDEFGTERVVPLVSAVHMRVFFGSETVISDASPRTVWHSRDHSVVHTMVLRDPV